MLRRFVISSRVSAFLRKADVPPPHIGVSRQRRLRQDEVERLEKFAHKTKNPLLVQTAQKARHYYEQKGRPEGPGVHETWITQAEANELFSLAQSSGDKDLLDIARYAQSVANTSHYGLEPQPEGFHEILEAARKAAETPPEKTPWITPERLAALRKIAKRTADPLLIKTLEKAKKIASGEKESDKLELHTFTRREVIELSSLADKTKDPEIRHFADYARSVYDTIVDGIERRGEVEHILEKGQQELEEMEMHQQQSTRRTPQPSIDNIKV
jgi:hypothetical protein